jgi:surface protein
MEQMFQRCEQLESLDLSNFNVQNVVNMKNMFNVCNRLEYLDISNFNPNINDHNNVDRMLGGLYNILKYINIYNIKNEAIKLEISICNSITQNNNLIICQSEGILYNSNAIYACCDFTKSPLQCDYSNDYIIVKYKDAVSYTSGFRNNNIPSRNQISYILNNDWLYKVSPLSIAADNSIKIYFSDKV